MTPSDPHDASGVRTGHASPTAGRVADGSGPGPSDDLPSDDRPCDDSLFDDIPYVSAPAALQNGGMIMSTVRVAP